MARKPTPPDKPLREWRISIMREKVHYLGLSLPADEEGFRIEPAATLPPDRRAVK